MKTTITQISAYSLSLLDNFMGYFIFSSIHFAHTMQSPSVVTIICKDEISGDSD